MRVNNGAASNARGASLLAVACLALGVLAFGICRVWVENEAVHQSTILLPELYAYLAEIGGFRDQTAQRVGFLVWFGFLWLGVLAILLAPVDLVGGLARSSARLRRSSALGIMGLAFLFFWETRGDRGLMSTLPVWALCAGIGLAYCLGFLYRIKWLKYFWLIALPILGLFGLILLLSGLFLPADISFWNSFMVSMVETHFAMLLGPAEKLSHGQMPFSDIASHYGILPSAMVAGAERLGAIPGWGGLYRTIQALQVTLFVILAVSLAFLRPLGGGTVRTAHYVLIPLLLVVPDLATSYQMTWFPNQTGWRFLPFACALMAFVLLRRATTRVRGLWLGGLSAVMLFYNPETAIAVIFGSIVFATLAAPSFSLLRTAQALGWILVGMVPGLMMVGALLSVVAGGWDNVAFGDLFGFLLRFNQGFGGLRLTDIDALALVIALHAGAILFGAAQKWRRRPLPAKAQVRVAVAAILSLWFAYYLNRPQTLNLWSHVYLFAVLAPVLWDPRRLALLWSGPMPRLQAIQIPSMFLFALVVHGVVTSHQSQRDLAALQVSRSDRAIPLSGVWLQTPVAKHLLDLAETLRSHPERDRLIYFTPFAFSMPLVSDVHPDLPVRDPFWETQTQDALDDLLLRVQVAAPPVILLHDLKSVPGDIFGGDNVGALYSRISDLMSRDFALTGTMGGWLVLERRAGSAEAEVTK